MTVLLLAGSSYCYSQFDDVWVFGLYTGIKFTGGSATPIYTGMLSGIGDCASICDRKGQLLFYTQGSLVWTRNNVLMPDGSDLTGLGSTIQLHRDGVLITPFPGNPDKYFIFSEANRGLHGKLYYSVVDMTLNNGLGDIVAGQKGILVDSNLRFTEGVAGDDCNLWVVAHDADTNGFRAYQITSAGVNTTPVVSYSGSDYFYNWPSGDFYLGELVASPSRKKLALAHNSGLGHGGGTEVFDFDPATGIVSNGILQGGFGPTSCLNTYDVAFSPDSKLLYAGNTSDGTVYPDGIYQLDLTGFSPLTIPVNVTHRSASLKLGPDNKIYLLLPWNPGPDSIGVIDFPDLPGAACQLSTNLFSFLPNTEGMRFNNDVPAIYYKDTLATSKSFSLCFGADSALLVADNTAGWAYEWQDGTEGKQRMVKAPGTYVLTYLTYNPCAYHRDSFKVDSINFTINLGNDTVICHSNAPLLLSTAAPVGSSYLWQDGSTAGQFTAVGSGTYWLKVTNRGCAVSDSINVQLTDIDQDLGADTVLCRSAELTLQANIPPGAGGLWSTGSTDVSLPVEETGEYTVLVTDGPCVGADTVQVTFEICTCAVSMPDAFTPNNDGINDLFRPVTEPGCLVAGYQLSVYNRWGQRVFYGQNPLAGWDGTQAGMEAEMGSYMYIVELEAGTDKKKFRQQGNVILVR